ncbi:FAD-dependent oxidoreductase [Chloroflexota bacterium]
MGKIGDKLISQTPFTKLFEPFQIGEMELKNRIVRSAMHSFFGATDGHVTDQLLDYYEALAKGGSGLVIVEYTCIDTQAGRTGPRQIAIDDDKFIPGLRTLAQVIQKNGAKAAIQLEHGGRVALSAVTGVQLVAPSAIAAAGAEYELPRELTVAEIEELVVRFAKGAERAKRAGFDGVELHGAQTYLINQFLSPAANKRKDAYGGNLENRARFLLGVIGAIRQSVGPTYPLWPRLNGMEFGIPDGIRIEDTRELARMVEKAGASAIHVMASSPALLYPPMCEPPGSKVHLAEAVKKVVNVPVIAVGKITPEVGERVLSEGKADLVAIGKALWADPELPNKAASGRLDDITPCLECYRCREYARETGSLACAVNAALGREREYRITPAKKPKRILVVGGGPAGMEAARIAAMRKHEVVLYEKGECLGGQLILAAIPPYKAAIKTLTEYLSNQVRKLGVGVEMGKAVTAALIEEAKPDAVVLATGIAPSIPNIPGMQGDSVVTVEDVLTGEVQVGDRVVVIGGGMVGCETAEFLVAQGRKATILEELPQMAPKLPLIAREPLLRRLAAAGVDMLVSVKCTQVTEKGLEVEDKEGRRRTIEADTVILAAGSRPNQELLESLKGRVSEIHLAGDCLEPRDIMGAIADGARVGRAL